MNELGSQQLPDETDSPAVPDARRREPAAWQFSLGSMFVLTTAAAVTAALIPEKGWGTLVLSAGMAVTWLNVRGSFVRWQTPRGQLWLFIAAWVLFAVSLALPAIPAIGFIYGWEAAVGLVLVEWDQGVKLLQREDWSTIQVRNDVVSFFWMTLMNAANLLMLLSPFLLWRLRRGKGQLLANSFAVSCVATWMIPFAGYIGYWIGWDVWCASMMLLLIARRLTRRVGLAMVSVAVLLAAAFWLNRHL